MSIASIMQFGLGCPCICIPGCTNPFTVPPQMSLTMNFSNGFGSDLTAFDELDGTSWVVGDNYEYGLVEDYVYSQTECTHRWWNDGYNENLSMADYDTLTFMKSYTRSSIPYHIMMSEPSIWVRFGYDPNFLTDLYMFTHYRIGIFRADLNPKQFMGGVTSGYEDFLLNNGLTPVDPTGLFNGTWCIDLETGSPPFSWGTTVCI